MKYRIDIGSPPDYEEVVAYILINGEEIALLQKEEGPDKLKIEFFDVPIQTEIYYDVFIEALREAKEELLKQQLQNTPAISSLQTADQIFQYLKRYLILL